MQLKEEMTHQDQTSKKKIVQLESWLTEKNATVTQLQLNLQQVQGVLSEKEAKIKQLEADAKKNLDQANEAKK